MFAIFLKEINSFLSSAIAYIVIGVFLTGIGAFMWIFPNTNVFDYGYADMESLFLLAPYVYVFLIPAITMKTFAEEKKAGTIELLLTLPLRDWEIILGKYLASWFLVLFSILPTILYYYSVSELGNPVGNIDSAGTLGSYIGLALLGAVFTAIGIFASAITNNQIISFIVAAFLCYIIYDGFTSLANFNSTSDISFFIAQVGIDYHYESIRRGLIDSRNVIYFLSMIFLMLAATKLTLSSRKW